MTLGSLGLSIALVGLPRPVHAAPAPATTATQPPAETREPEGSPDEGEAPVETEGDDGGEGPEAELAPEASAAAEGEPDGSAEGGVDADEAAAEDATADASGPGQAPAPGTLGPTAAPLRPMQTAAWWTMFGAFTLGTTAGVLAGLAERQEDRATRLSTLFDAETGAQPLYADRKDEYERYLRRGEGYATAALGVGIVAGAATIAAITLFAIDARRQRGDAARRPKAPPRRAALRVRGGGMEVRF